MKNEEKKEEVLKIETSKAVRLLFDYVVTLENLLPMVTRNQKVWERPISMSERLELLKAVAGYRASLYEKVEEENPDMKGKSYSITRTHISVATHQDNPSQ